MFEHCYFLYLVSFLDYRCLENIIFAQIADRSRRQPHNRLPPIRHTSQRSVRQHAVQYYDDTSSDEYDDRRRQVSTASDDDDDSYSHY